MTLPPERWHKLNKDGGVNNATGAVVGGDFIRDSSGCWVMGYSWSIGCCLIRAAMDLVTAVTREEMLELVMAVRGLLSRSWQVSVSHVLRGANTAADSVTKLARDCPLALTDRPGLQVLLDPFSAVLDVLNDDVSGLSSYTNAQHFSFVFCWLLASGEHRPVRAGPAGLN
ncbi:hypothetical protein V6Z12_A02G065500 [Gossypium hirsutum]